MNVTEVKSECGTYKVTKRPFRNGHRYEIDGEVVPRFSEIKDAIIAAGKGLDYYKAAQKIGGFQSLLNERPVSQLIDLSPYEVMKLLPQDRAALKRGTEVHLAIEEGELNPADHSAEVQPYIRAAAGFHDQHELEVEAQELIVGSKQYRYAGTVDWRGKVNGIPTLIDWKTATKAGREPYDSYHLQLAAYETACIEQGMLPTSQRLIVMLYPDGTYRPFECKATVGDWLEALNWWHALSGLRERIAA